VGVGLGVGLGVGDGVGLGVGDGVTAGATVTSSVVEALLFPPVGSLTCGVLMAMALSNVNDLAPVSVHLRVQTSSTVMGEL
jgi:hypothetical protein